MGGYDWFCEALRIVLGIEQQAREAALWPDVEWYHSSIINCKILNITVRHMIMSLIKDYLRADSEVWLLFLCFFRVFFLQFLHSFYIFSLSNSYLCPCWKHARALLNRKRPFGSGKLFRLQGASGGGWSTHLAGAERPVVPGGGGPRAAEALSEERMGWAPDACGMLLVQLMGRGRGSVVPPRLIPPTRLLQAPHIPSVRHWVTRLCVE